MSKIYSVLADAVVTIHALYVSFIVIGLFLILLGRAFHWSWVRNFWFRIVHLTMMGIVVVESLLGITCPLTTWEYSLRKAAAEPIDGGSFIARIAHQSIFIDASPAMFTLIYVAFFGAVLLSLVLVPPRWQTRNGL